MTQLPVGARIMARSLVPARMADCLSQSRILVFPEEEFE